MKKTKKISGASVNLTTASVHRLIKPMNKTTHGKQHANATMYKFLLLAIFYRP
jgi:hypothetical protein